MADGDGQVVFTIDLDDSAFQAGLKRLQNTVDTFCHTVLSAFTLSAAQLAAANAAGMRWAGSFAAGMLLSNAAVTAAQHTASSAALAAQATGTAAGRGAGQSMVDGIAAGAASRGSALNAALMRIVRSALAAARRAAGISSPSALFRDEVGRYLALGIQTGFTDTMEKSVLPSIAQSVAAGASAAGQALSGTLLSGVQRTLNVNLALPSAARIAQPGQGANAVLNGASARRAADSVTNLTQNITFSSAPQTPDEVARAVRRQTTYGLAAARG